MDKFSYGYSFDNFSKVSSPSLSPNLLVTSSSSSSSNQSENHRYLRNRSTPVSSIGSNNIVSTLSCDRLRTVRSFTAKLELEYFYLVETKSVITTPAWLQDISAAIVQAILLALHRCNENHQPQYAVDRSFPHRLASGNHCVPSHGGEACSVVRGITHIYLDGDVAMVRRLVYTAIELLLEGEAPHILFFDDEKSEVAYTRFLQPIREELVLLSASNSEDQVISNDNIVKVSFVSGIVVFVLVAMAMYGLLYRNHTPSAQPKPRTKYTSAATSNAAQERLHSHDERHIRSESQDEEYYYHHRRRRHYRHHYRHHRSYHQHRMHHPYYHHHEATATSLSSSPSSFLYDDSSSSSNSGTTPSLQRHRRYRHRYSRCMVVNLDHNSSLVASDITTSDLSCGGTSSVLSSTSSVSSTTSSLLSLSRLLEKIEEEDDEIIIGNETKQKKNVKDRGRCIANEAHGYHEQNISKLIQHGHFNYPPVLTQHQQRRSETLQPTFYDIHEDYKRNFSNFVPAMISASFLGNSLLLSPIPRFDIDDDNTIASKSFVSKSALPYSDNDARIMIHETSLISELTMDSMLICNNYSTPHSNHYKLIDNAEDEVVEEKHNCIANANDTDNSDVYSICNTIATPVWLYDLILHLEKSKTTKCLES